MNAAKSFEPMDHQTLFIATNGDSESTLCITKAAAAAQLNLKIAEGADSGLHILKALIDTEKTPAMIIIGPALNQALDTAQSAHRLAPLTHIAFIIYPEQHDDLQQHMGDIGMIGDYWSISDVNSERLSGTLGDIAQACLQRRDLRGTLDSINRQLSQYKPTALSQYRKLLVSEKYLSTVLSTTPDAIVAANEHGEIVAWNSGAVKLFKIPERSALGRNLETVAGGDWPQHIRSALRKLADGEQSIHLEIECAQYNKRTFYLEASLSALYEDNNMSVVCIVARDITARRTAQEALHHANAELERSNLELQQFAYIASHDLQSPLRSISGFLQLLHHEYHGKLSDQADEWIDFTVRNVSRMQTLIDDLLSYSRIDSRARPFGTVDFNHVLESVTAMLDSSIQDSGAVITHDTLPTVRGDPSQLAQLLINLVANAIKYQGKAPPRIHVAAEKTAQEWLFSVKDNGIGIDRKHLERIFEIFRRLHTAKTHPGTGIGLAVCRRVVARHGGKIWAESKPGDGSIFYFTIPAKEAINDQHSPA